MINVEHLGARIIIGFGDGELFITDSTLFGLIVAVIIAILGIWLGSGLEKVPKGKQVVAEFLVEKVYSYTENNMGKENLAYAPYVGTLFGFVFCTSSFGLLGFRPITADLNVTAAFALLTFLMIQVNSIRVHGLKGKLKEMCDPYPFMFPLKIIEEISLPVSLALRLFGNILGGFIVIELWMEFMTWLSSFITDIPFLRAVTVLPLNLFFDIAEPAIQTFIFTTLTVMNLATAIKVVGHGHDN
jgi:F-type H+-transporting ATPase subunit a